jgi:Tfp pilus assembly protein PilZ
VEGGIFIPTAREYKLGDDIYVLLSYRTIHNLIRLL